MRPFDHTGLRNPRLLWRPHEPAESGEKPTAAVTKAGMPRQTANARRSARFAADHRTIGALTVCDGSADSKAPKRQPSR